MTDPDASEALENVGPAVWFARGCGALFVVLAILWTFQVPSQLGIALFKEQFLLVCLGLSGAAVFLTLRWNGGRAGRSSRPSLPGNLSWNRWKF